jgi:hypothetical protein
MTRLGLTMTMNSFQARNAWYVNLLLQSFCNHPKAMKDTAMSTYKSGGLMKSAMTASIVICHVNLIKIASRRLNNA